jgi:hypothetical protein
MGRQGAAACVFLEDAARPLGGLLQQLLHGVGVDHRRSESFGQCGLSGESSDHHDLDVGMEGVQDGHGRRAQRAAAIDEDLAPGWRGMPGDGVE